MPLSMAGALSETLGEARGQARGAAARSRPLASLSRAALSLAVVALAPLSWAVASAANTAQAGSLLNRRELESEIPGIGPRWQAGLLFAQDGQIDNRRRLMRALELACARLGVIFQEGAEIGRAHV